MILPTSAPAIRPTIAPAGPNTAPAAAPATERTRAAMIENLVGWAKPTDRANARPRACPPLTRRRHPEVLAALRGEPRRMGHKRLRPSFEMRARARSSG